MKVPFFSRTPLSHLSLTSSPLAKVTVRASPSRTERAGRELAGKHVDGLTPTPFRPTVFLKAEPPYFTAGVHLADGRRERFEGMPRP